MTTPARPTLGPHMSLVCFQYLRVGTEEVAERAPIVAAGRKRGFDLVESLGLLGSINDAATMQARLDASLGANGTRLCLIQQIAPRPAGGYEVRLTEGACTAGQTANEPICAFTLGVFIGAISAMTGIRMRGEETTCSACGAPECVYQIIPI
jgi:hypothetical protein